VNAEENPERRTRTDQEVDDLVRALQSYGVLTRANLRTRSGASEWPDNSFEVVLRRGLDNGRIKQLGDLFEVGADVRDLSDADFDPT
jgi:hypothetical protein